MSLMSSRHEHTFVDAILSQLVLPQTGRVTLDHTTVQAAGVSPGWWEAHAGLFYYEVTCRGWQARLGAQGIVVVDASRPPAPVVVAGDPSESEAF